MSPVESVLGFALAAGMGFIFSLLGAGGSIFAVPVLVFLLHQNVSTAMGTALSMVCAAATVGSVRHAREGRVVLRVAVYFGGGAIGGAWLGARYLHPLFSEKTVLMLFAGMLLAAGLRMLVPQQEQAAEKPIDMRAGMLVPCGFVLGIVTGLIGVGGGFLIVPILIWAAHLPLPKAIGTSLAVIALSSLSGALGFAVSGHVNAPVLAVTASGAAMGAWGGGAFVDKVPQRALRGGFAALALCVAVVVGWKALTS
ncbi:MAG: sulfite exporter TauE/SafE family protein [Myxococcaceae bacterium]|nr:sulfite exporter TauE/SafE family protein [Myxococcaceae bacterium]